MTAVKELTGMSKAIDELEKKERARRKDANKWDTILYGTIGLGYLAFAISMLFGDHPGNAVFEFAIFIWVGIVYLACLKINDQRYVINMMSGLNRLERDELEKAVADSRKTGTK